MSFIFPKTNNMQLRSVGVRDLGYSRAAGSGKTRTVAALVADEFVASPTARSALAAPTGKAAARMAESVAESIDLLSAADDEPIVAAASALQLVVPSTVHRLLGAEVQTAFVTTFIIRFRSISLWSMRRRCCHCHSSMPFFKHCIPPQGWCSSEMQASWRVLMRVQCSAISREQTVQFIHA